MKEAFITKNFGADATKLLAHIEVILESYASQGYTLSLRQLYYQLVAANIVPNTERSYKNVGNLVSDARLAGIIDWKAIEDRGRTVSRNPHWDNPRDFLEGCIPQFAVRKWDTQPCYIEVMVEKQALEGVLEPVCGDLDISFMANKGYSSSSALYECGHRFRAQLREKKECHIIYLGDHDPSGIDMTRDVIDRVNQFSKAERMFSEEIHVHRVALNMDQIRKLNPPENPAKLTDSRAEGYIEKFGRSSWELDAIEPKALAKLVTDEVYSLRDADLWAAAVEKEDAMRAELEAMAKKSKFK